MSERSTSELRPAPGFQWDVLRSPLYVYKCRSGFNLVDLVVASF